MSQSYTLVCGLEIHTELKTNSKMFCSCKNDPFAALKPNLHTCPVCLGMPGGLPVASKKAIESTIRLGLALGCEISLFSKFDRKHYFYPDLPKGYQISQYDQPLCRNGLIETELGSVRIHRIHLEEDTAKMVHKTIDGRALSLIDFNRSGVPLVEIVTEPDIHRPAQAKAFAKALRDIIRALDISDADMEKGSMRLEANISVTTDPAQLPHYKVEVKNINSFRYLEQAITYEFSRHVSLLEKGEYPVQETRGWNETKVQTISQRVKESAEDYRYFPDPDIPPLVFTQEWIDELGKSLPELPQARQKRYESLGVRSQFAWLLSEPEVPSSIVDVMFAKAKEISLMPDQVASVVINKKIDLSSTSPEEIIRIAQEQFTKESVDPQVLDSVIQKVIVAQGQAVSDFRGGRQQSFGFLMGAVMRELGKNVDATVIKDALLKELNS